MKQGIVYLSHRFYLPFYNIYGYNFRCPVSNIIHPTNPFHSIWFSALSCSVTPSFSASSFPDIDNYIGLTHTLFTLEDLYGVKINSIDGELCLTLDKSKGASYLSMFDIFSAWKRESEKFQNGEIEKEEYDTWRYNYPKIEAERTKDALDVRRAEKNGENE